MTGCGELFEFPLASVIHRIHYHDVACAELGGGQQHWTHSVPEDEVPAVEGDVQRVPLHLHRGLPHRLELQTLGLGEI